MLTNDKQLPCVERGLHDALNKLSRLACIWSALWHVNKFQNAGWQIVALIEKDEALAGVTSMRNAIIIVALLTCTAGESGKVFAVVAQEVLDLAQSAVLAILKLIRGLFWGLFLFCRRSIAA